MHESTVIDDPLMRLIEWHTPVAQPRPHRRPTPDVAHGEQVDVVRMPDGPRPRNDGDTT